MKRLHTTLILTLFTFFTLLMLTPVAARAAVEKNVTYRAHVQQKGWMSWQTDGSTAGTSGQALRVEALELKLTRGAHFSGIRYRSFVNGSGWETGWKRDGVTSGTTGKKKSIGAIEVKLYGLAAEQYDVWYRVHAQKIGWMGWTKNGKTAGTTGYNYRLEAIQIKLVAKGGKAPGSTKDASKIAGKVICIDPGHETTPVSGREPVGPGSSTTKLKVTTGSYGKWSRKNEYEINLEVSLKLKAELERRGYRVVMTRTTNNVSLSNIQRAQIANSAKADIFIRIHCNSMPNYPGLNGVLCYGPTLGNRYHSRAVNQASQRLCTLLRDGQCAATGQRKESNLYQDDMTGTNWANMPTAIVEMGFMSNRTEDLQMASSAFQTKIANGLANGVDNYFK